MSTELQLNIPRPMRALQTFITQHEAQLFSKAPQGYDVSAAVNRTLYAIRKNPTLLKCDPASLFDCVLESVENGLEVSGIREEAYIVPYGQKATLIPSYKGLLKLVRNTGELVDVRTAVVRAGDEFSYNEADDVLVHHKATDDDRESRPITHCYVVFDMRDGSKKRTVWTKSEVDAHAKRYSEAYRRAEAYIRSMDGKELDPKKLSLWHTNWSVYAYKTLIRNTVRRGRLPLSESVATMIGRDDDDRGVVISPSEAQSITFDDVEEAIEVKQVPEVAEETVEEESLTVVQQFLRDVAACQNLGQVTGCKEHWRDAVEDGAEQERIDEWRHYVDTTCDERAASIRESRRDTPEED